MPDIVSSPADITPPSISLADVAKPAAPARCCANTPRSDPSMPLASPDIPPASPVMPVTAPMAEPSVPARLIPMASPSDANIPYPNDVSPSSNPPPMVFMALPITDWIPAMGFSAEKDDSAELNGPGSPSPTPPSRPAPAIIVNADKPDPQAIRLFLH